MRVLPDATRDDHPPLDVIVVPGGNGTRAQGVSAGIDMALWLVGQLHGEDHARATQRYIQYDPAPPYGDAD